MLVYLGCESCRQSSARLPQGRTASSGAEELERPCSVSAPTCLARSDDRSSRASSNSPPATSAGNPCSCSEFDQSSEPALTPRFAHSEAAVPETGRGIGDSIVVSGCSLWDAQEHVVSPFFQTNATICCVTVVTCVHCLFSFQYARTTRGAYVSWLRPYHRNQSADKLP